MVYYAATGANVRLLTKLATVELVFLALSFCVDGSTGGQRNPDMALRTPRSLSIESSTTPRGVINNNQITMTNKGLAKYITPVGTDW